MHEKRDLNEMILSYQEDPATSLGSIFSASSNSADILYLWHHITKGKKSDSSFTNILLPWPGVLKPIWGWHAVVECVCFGLASPFW